MSVDDRPLSALLSQGWEVLQYSASIGDSGTLEHCFLLRRQGTTKVLIVRKKMMGEGVTSEELEV
ncbi:MAG: hypothetical protein ABL864_00340 [Terricaulis sp.]